MTPTQHGYTNIVMIVADGLGVGDLGCLGNPYVDTPVLDTLAETGVVLTQHYAASAGDAPARAGLLTGRYPHRTGALDGAAHRGLDRISRAETTVAELFRSAGHATGMVGKWHNGALDRRYHPNARGFQEFAGFSGAWMDSYDWILDINGRAQRSDGRVLTDVFSLLAGAFIKRHREEPFFLYVAYDAPQGPLKAPERAVQAYRDGGRFNEAVCRFHARVHQMDTGIGQILRTLGECGLGENTLVLVTSDTGPWLGEARAPDGRAYSMARFNGPLRGMRGEVLEGGIRTPAIVRWPARLPAGVRTDALVHACDWMPTLAAAAGLTARPAFPYDGENVLAALEEGRLDRDRRDLDRDQPWFWHYNAYAPVPGCNVAVREGPWKLVWPAIPEAMARLPIDEIWAQGLARVPHFETPVDASPVERTVSKPRKPALYNLVDDPSESRNLRRQYPDRARQMTLLFAEWFDEVNRDRRQRPDVWRSR